MSKALKHNLFTYKYMYKQFKEAITTISETRLYFKQLTVEFEQNTALNTCLFHL